MKKGFLICLICVLFNVFLCSVGTVYCSTSEHIDFFYNQKIFTYNLEDNIKISTIFNQNYEINKYNRFGSKQERVDLLKKLVSIGIEKSVALDYLFPNITKTLNSIEKNLNLKPQNAKLKINSNSKNVFEITPERYGVEVDKISLIDEIYSTYISNKPLKFNIPTKKIKPEIIKNDLLKHTHLRSDFSTDISSSSDSRKHNIKNALNSLNRIQILPNETFSFNKAVGKRTAENGYREAKIIINNEFVDGLGGGVCQVSSTLYNSALLAGLEIVEANKHSKQVGYVKYGFDAMVNFGSSDLKFKNNTNEKLTIITNYSNKIARIRIFGEGLNNTTYKLTNEISNIVEPIEEFSQDLTGEYKDKVVYEDEQFCLKKGSRGMDIKSYREKYENNQLVSKELLRHDKFKVENTKIIYGNLKRELKNEKSQEFNILASLL